MSFHDGILPREGFHADVLGGLVQHSLLNPILTIPVLLLANYHQKGHQLAAQHMRTFSIVKVAAALGVMRLLNGWLSQRAVNNGVTDTYDWSKEIVLITGGADGIGRQIALMFASKNVKVVVLDVQPMTYEAPPSVTYMKCDITSASALSEVHQKIKRANGGQSPSIIILNAGICKGRSILDSTARDVSLTFEVNAISHYTLAREFLPSIVEANHGTVVTVASSAAWATAPRMVEYAASKAAALAFHEGLSAELVSVYKAPKVRTIVVNQGHTKTRLFQGFNAGGGFFGPPLEVDTVAEAIVRKVMSGSSGQIILPGFYKGLVANFRSLPLWMQHWSRIDLVRVMKEWNGRQVDLGGSPAVAT
ncbi:hypothetical protein FH972_025487 [Carpinus fangiana]|uniref:Short-chain dehydrogenase/reductase 3 n=1 Tax=Carpinus fangiana TaxID=176857 RepID=A0A5N6L165_9ROSI|nr:hypothetical protein FH972_025487 [Carpinus fangiana]